MGTEWLSIAKNVIGAAPQIFGAVRDFISLKSEFNKIVNGPPSLEKDIAHAIIAGRQSEVEIIFSQHPELQVQPFMITAALEGLKRAVGKDDLELQDAIMSTASSLLATNLHNLRRSADKTELSYDPDAVDATLFRIRLENFFTDRLAQDLYTMFEKHKEKLTQILDTPAPPGPSSLQPAA